MTPTQLPTVIDSGNHLVQVVSAASDILVAIAALATVLAAWFGLSAWKRELRGRRCFDAAFEMMSALIALREQFQMSRSSMILTAEAERAAKILKVNLEGLSPDETQDRMFGAASLLRRNQVVECWRVVQAKAGPIEILLGDSIEEPLISIKQIIHGFVFACDNYGYSTQERASSFGPQSPEQKQSIRRWIGASGSSDNPDKHAAQMNEAVKQIRNQMREYLK